MGFRPFVCLAAIVGFLLVHPGALAQEEPQPVVQAARIVVEHDEGGLSSVEATFDVGNVGEEGLEHLFVRRPGVEVQDFSVDGEPIDLPEQAAGITRVGVPVSGEQTSYTINYTVSRNDGVFVVPVLGPEAPRDATDRAVTIEVVLPSNMALAGETFPSLDHRETRDDREVVVHRVINVPSAVITEYGEDGRFSLSDWITVAALLVFAVVLILWYRQSLTGRTSE